MLKNDKKVKEIHDQATRIEEARREGIQIARIEIAKKLIEKGMDIDLIREVTELTEEEITDLIKANITAKREMGMSILCKHILIKEDENIVEKCMILDVETEYMNIYKAKSVVE